MLRTGLILQCYELSRRGKMVVAQIGMRDWAAYEALHNRASAEEIARKGDKLPEAEARELFPELRDYSYRH